MPIIHHRGWLWLEWLALFVALPIVLSITGLKGALFITLCALAVGALLAWKLLTGERIRSLFKLSDITRAEWRRMWPLFALSMVVLLIFTWVIAPERLFSFVVERPLMWAVVMLLYPILSVIPQEIIYRLFIFTRYQAIFPKDWMMIAASAFAFGHAHIIMNNPIGYWLSIAGGVIFAITYQRTKSLSLVWLQHTLYGNYVFTMGLGYYFYSGAAHLHGGG